MDSQPLLLTNQAELDEALARLRQPGHKLGLVPTMGALHEGHLSLVRRSVELCDTTLVSVFVNPAQFGESRDLDLYPRDIEHDLQLLAQAGAELVFAPSEEEIYPAGFSDWIEPPCLANRWEGAARPGHFRGVCTVVHQLFRRIPAEFAFFGAKDYQQAQVIGQLVATHRLPVQIVVCPTIREPDGLAMSSRNTYLSDAERTRARHLFESLRQAQLSVDAGTIQSVELINQIHLGLANGGIEKVDYVAIVDPTTLEPVDRLDRPARLLVAAHVGPARLIDNCLLSPNREI